MSARAESLSTQGPPRKVTGRPQPNIRVALIVGAITLVGLLVRLPSFGNSIAGDETSTYWIVIGHSLSQVMRLIKPPQEVSPPLYFVVAWATKGFLGDSASSLLLISLLTGTAAMPLTYLLGMRLVGRRGAALVATSLMAVAPFMIYYS